MNTILVTAITVLSVSISLVTALYFIMKQRQTESEYDLKLNKVKLEAMREFYEGKIYELNEKLVSTPDRWKDVNHLLLNTQTSEKETSLYLSNFLKSHGLTINDLEVEKKSVFVLTPFHEKNMKEYNVIASTCQNIGLQCSRGDEEYVKGDLLPHILKKIAKSRFVIANINGRNPNVFYELGLAHAMDKPVIIVSNIVEEIPFDIKSKNIILYKNEIELRNELNRTITKLFLDNK
jgi:hypothetical protein